MLTEKQIAPAPLSTEAVGEIERRANAATEGPWDIREHGLEFHGQRYMRHDVVHPNGDAELGNWMMAERVRRIEDAKFIAHARDDIPALLATLRAKDAEIERLRGALEFLIGEYDPGLSPMYQHLSEARHRARAALHPQWK